MLFYIRRKLIHLIPITFAVTALSFFFIDLLPGDVADAIAGVGTDSTVIDEAAIQAIRKDLGLDQPVIVRYFSWLGNALVGELGKSYQTGQTVADAIALRLPVTLQLLVMAQLLAVVFAVPAGILAAYRAGKVTDQVVTTLTFAFLAAPSFIIATDSSIGLVRSTLLSAAPIGFIFSNVPAMSASISGEIVYGSS